MIVKHNVFVRLEAVKSTNGDKWIYLIMLPSHMPHYASCPSVSPIWLVTGKRKNT